MQFLHDLMHQVNNYALLQFSLEISGWFQISTVLMLLHCLLDVPSC